MPDNKHRPVIYLAFANAHDNRASYLRNLAEEARRLRKVLMQKEAPYEFALNQDLTIDELLQELRKDRHRIAIFHYGGHAGSYGFMLESASGHGEVAHVGGLTKLFAQQRALHVVFLNGCSTQEQAQALLKVGIPVVIATAEAIDDEMAMQFATTFYEELNADATIAEAFQRAEAALETKHDSAKRGVLYHTKEAIPKGPPWTLYYTNEKDIQVRLADIVDDPLWGLPPLPCMDLPAQPFRGLERFERKHAEIFFGRGVEIRDLYYRISNPAAEPIILLYGRSGVGKSSLLEAGLLTRLEAEHECRYKRRDQEAGLTGSLAEILGAGAGNKSVQQAWLDLQAQVKKPVIVVLDQVEEIFTRAYRDQTAQTAELTDFLTTLKTLFAEPDQRPHGKLILGFRKEYLAEIEQHLRENELPYKQVFLEHLNQHGIQEVVVGVTSTPRLQEKYGLTIKMEPSMIAHDLVQDIRSPIAPTLQMLLTKLWEQAIARNRAQPVFDLQLYHVLKQKGILLGDFLDQQLLLLKKNNAEPIDSGLALDLLFYHTTPFATAEQHSAKELTDFYRTHSKQALQWLLQQCKDLYLLVDPNNQQAETIRDLAHLADPSDQQAETRSGLAHDALASLVHERFHRSVAPGQRARRILENRTAEWQNQNQQGALLKESDLKIIRRGKNGMRAWTAEEDSLVKKSTEEANKQKWTLRSLVTAVVVLVLGLALYRINRLDQDERQFEEQAKTESRQLANSSLQALVKDPVASLAGVLPALPAKSAPRPYVSAAEFALVQALHTSLERQYIPVAKPPLTKEQIDVGKTWIAVGGDTMRWIKLDLSQSITITGPITTAKKVSWATDGETLLSYANNHVYVWSDQHLVISTTFAAPIACAEWRPKMAQMAVCSGKTIQLWSYKANQLMPLHDAHGNVLNFPGNVLAARWSPDGRWLAVWDTATSRAGQSYVIWDGQQDRLFAQTPITYTERVRESTWSSDSLHLVAAASVTSTLRIWQITPSTQTLRLMLPKKVDGVAFVDPQHFVTWGKGDVTRLWSNAGQPLRQFGLADDFVLRIALSPDQRQLLTLLSNGSGQLWDIESGERLAVFCCHDKTILGANWHKTPSGNYLLTNSIDGTVRVWLLPDGKETIQHPALVTLRGHTWGTSNQPESADILRMDWHTDQQLLTYGIDGSLRLWQVFDEQGVPLCAGIDANNRPICFDFSRAFTNLSPGSTTAHWINNQSWVTADRQGVVRRCSLTACDTQVLAHNITKSTETIWSSDGQRVFTYTKGLAGQVVDFSTKTAIASVSAPITAAFWTELGLLISRDANGVSLVQPDTGITLTTLSQFTATLTAAQLSSDGRLAMADQNGVIHLWKPQPGQKGQKIEDNLPTKDFLPIHTLVWSKDNKRLFSAGSKVTLWNMETGKAIWRTKETEDKAHIALSPDGQMVAITTGNEFFVVDRESGNQLWHNQEHTQPVNGIQWVVGAQWPDQERNNWFVSHLIRLLNQMPWEPASSRWLLLTWSGDGTTRLWDWESRTELMRLSDTGPLNGVAVSPDGTHLLTIALTSDTNSSTARIWQIALQAPERWLEMAQERITRVTH